MKKGYLKLTLALLICALMIFTIVGCDKEEQQPPHTHQYTETVTKAPTCTEEGVKTFTCSCADSYTEVIEKLSHTEVTVPGKAATCTEAGLTEGKKCSVCDTVIVAQGAIEALGHTEVTVPGKAATCTEAGLTEGKKCSVCNTVTVEQESIEALGHTEVTVPGKAATCTEAGLTDGKKCSVCNTVTVEQKPIGALGHNEVNVPGKAASCTEAGLTDGKKCSVCNTVTVEQKPIGALGHTEVTVPGKAASCTEEGLTDGKKCSVCDTVTVRQIVILKKGHVYDDDTDLICNVCDTKRDCLHAETVPVPGKAASCTEPGLKDGVNCGICGDIIVAQEVIPATGHLDKVTIPAKDATCTEAGATAGTKCNTCGSVLEKPAVIEAKGHTEKILTAKAATCTETGLTEGKMCSVCEEILVEQEVVPVIDHTYTDEWKHDAEYHWHECSCGAKSGSAAHTHTDDQDTTCDVCGEIRAVAPVILEGEIVKEYDIYELENKTDLVIDFANNVNNISSLPLKYSVKCGDDAIVLDGTSYELTFASYTDETVYKIFTVTVSYTLNGETETAEYTYKLGLKDTGAYRVSNGGFESGLDGWTLNNTLGDAPFGGIDNKTTFWGEGYVMNNVGSYFSSYADGASEASQGTLASPYFTVKSEYATYMLGGAGNHNVYITVENKAGEVLAIYRNTAFADFPAGEYSVEQKREMIGKTVFLANFVTYKVSLSDFAGEEVRFVIHDHASEGWGVVFFDELNTYYTAADALPENAILAENLLADKSKLDEELALEVTEQGDFTLDSFSSYREKLEAAKALIADVAVTQASVDEACAALKTAREALTVRPILAVEGANLSFGIISGNSKEIVLSDYINTNGLSKITYAVSAGDPAITVSPVKDGKFTITAGEVSEAAEVKVSIVTSYDGKEKLTVELTAEITNDLAPSVFNEEVVKALDIFMLENKSGILLDLSENVDNVGNLALSYAVNGSAVEGSTYTFSFGTYTDSVKNETLTVTVSYVANGEEESVSYTYKLAIKDTTLNRLANGGFEDGMEGWVQVGNIGSVSTDKSYWTNENDGNGYQFLMDGEKMFSAYAPGALESAVGTLTSGSFKIGGSGFVSFKVGAMKDGNYVYVDVVDAQTKEILARFYNGLWADTTDGLKSGCTLVAYKADLSAHMGKEVFFRISDNADSGYGLFFADSFVTYYETEPDGFNVATPVGYEVSGTIYDVFNGGFEMGDVQGWWNNGEPGKVTGADAFFSGVAYGKDGNFLYSGVEDFGAGNGREGNTGVLTSSVFEIGGTGYITYMLGGGNAFCYVQIVDAVSGEILGRYRQQARNDAVLVKYVADLSAYVGRTVRVQLVDKATYDWGCVSFDNVVTYYTEKPEGTEAIDTRYELVNGSFESGKTAWVQNGDNLGEVINNEINEGWYTKNDDNKDGEYLFSFAFFGSDGGVVNVEAAKGNIESSAFVLKQGSFVSFRFGGAGGVSNHDVYIQLCRADGSVIATFYNDAPGKVNTRMNAYYYQYQGEDADCFFRVVDNSTGDYGCFVVDDFRVNLESAPEGFIAAIQ